MCTVNNGEAPGRPPFARRRAGEEETLFDEDMSNIKAPWLNFYGEVPQHLVYPDCSMVDMVERQAALYPDYLAFTFMGKKTTYKQMVAQIDQTAKAFASIGVKPGDRVTLCLPNCPQVVLCFYALNKIGAVASMIHPMSSIGEIAFYLKDAGSKVAVTLDQFYPKFEEVRKEYPLDTLLITSVADGLSLIKGIGFKLTQGRKNKLPKGAPVLYWKPFQQGGAAYTGDCFVERKGDDAAVILFSGGTTGKTKGILLSNLNFNSLGLQTIAMANCFKPGMKMLAAMPMFTASAWACAFTPCFPRAAPAFWCPGSPWKAMQSSSSRSSPT